MCYSATNVVSGQGRGVVVGTGDSAEIGQINKMVNTVRRVHIHYHIITFVHYLIKEIYVLCILGTWWAQGIAARSTRWSTRWVSG